MIDVLLPFYGDPQLLYKAAESVLGQSSPDLRLVVVDDGYPDPGVAEWFAQLDDPRTEYHRNPTNLGANGNYRRALELATAEHVVVMGADDLMLPNYIATLERALARFPDAAVVQCGVAVIDGEGRPTSPLVDRVKSRIRPRVTEPTLLGGESLLVSLLRGNWTYFPSLCWRTDAITRIGFRPQFHVVQDMALLVDVIREGGELVLAPETAFQYRRHAGSDSSVKTLTGSRFDEEKSYFALIEHDLERAGFARAARAARRHPTSRLHAAALLPVAARGRDAAAMRRLLRHATR